MKKLSFLLALVLLLNLAGCKKKDQEQTEEPPAPAVEEDEGQSAEQEPKLVLDTLKVEISRNDTDTALVLQAAKELPALLKSYFWEAFSDGNGVGIEIGEVVVTVGTSAAATAQALSQGSIDLAFLPAEDLIRYGGEAQVLQGDAPQLRLETAANMDLSDWNTADMEERYTANAVWAGGTKALLCTAPTEYGSRLAELAESGKTPTWAALDKARWGVLDESSLGGYRCANLYLADNYEGNEIGDLADVTTYDSYEELFRAAANEEIDLLVIGSDARVDVADAWVLGQSRTDQSGMRGFDREKSVWEEVRCIAVTETLYSTVVASAPEREDLEYSSWFNYALQEVLERLYLEKPELMAVLGSPQFTMTQDGELDALRRSMTIEEIH